MKFYLMSWYYQLLLKIYCDNLVIIFLFKNGNNYKGTKHMDIKYLHVKEEVLKERVSIEHIGKEIIIMYLLGFVV